MKHWLSMEKERMNEFPAPGTVNLCDWILVGFNFVVQPSRRRTSHGRFLRMVISNVLVFEVPYIRDDQVSSHD